jgi:Bacterial lectin
VSRLIGSAIVLLAPATGQAQGVKDLRLGGAATVLNERCVRLTPDVPYVNGSAWFPRPVDLTQSFSMTVELGLGQKDREGADGIVFVFHTAMSTGFRGEGMGFAGLSPSLGIEIDTYQNVHLDDPELDHIAVMTDGRSYHVGDAGLSILGNVEDGARHALAIRWDPAADRLDIRFGQRSRISVSGAEVRRTFGTETLVYWGVTAGTGRLSNTQDVCLEPALVGANRPRRGPSASLGALSNQ